MPKLHHLRNFVAVARARSLRSAARSLGLTQPALTRSVRELEAELGVALFQRHARGVSLTVAGERFLLRAQARGEMQGQVAVALSSAPVLSLLARAYAQFRRDWPDVHLRFVEGLFPAVEPALRDGRLDFYLGPRPERQLSASYQVALVHRNERVVLARRGHPLRTAGSLQALLEADWIVTGLRERREEEFEEQFSALGLRSPRVVTVAESLMALLALLASSDALAFLPRQWADTPLFNGVLEPIAVRESLMAPDIVQVTRAALPLTPAAERLSTLLLRTAVHDFGEPAGA